MIKGKTYYQILGVLDDAEDIVIRAAYKVLAQKYHPDKWSGSKDEATQRMSEINQAYTTLSDPQKRKTYDSELKQNNTAPNFESQSDDESLHGDAETIEDWRIACEHFPDLVNLDAALRRISLRLSSTFIIVILETKNYTHRHKIATKLEENFLKTYFGNNTEILVFAKELIIEKQKEAARELNKQISVIGRDIDAHRVIANISKKYNTARYRQSIKPQFTNFKAESQSTALRASSVFLAVIAIFIFFIGTISLLTIFNEKLSGTGNSAISKTNDSTGEKEPTKEIIQFVLDDFRVPVPNSHSDLYLKFQLDLRQLGTVAKLEKFLPTIRQKYIELLRKYNSEQLTNKNLQKKIRTELLILVNAIIEPELTAIFVLQNHDQFENLFIYELLGSSRNNVSEQAITEAKAHQSLIFLDLPVTAVTVQSTLR